MKLIRYILFIIVCLLVLGIVYWSFGQLLSWFLSLSIFWLIVIAIFGSMLWRLFKFLSGMLIGVASLFVPNRIFGFWTVLLLSILYGIWIIYNSWTMDIDYSGKVIFIAIVFTYLVIGLTYALISGSAAIFDEDYATDIDF